MFSCIQTQKTFSIGLSSREISIQLYRSPPYLSLKCHHHYDKPELDKEKNFI